MREQLVIALATGIALWSFPYFLQKQVPVQKPSKPNILFVVSDDQSYPHASAYGYKAVSTPNFDRVAREGVLFTKAYVASPGCSPSRAAILTGRNDWQIEEAGTHGSSFPSKYAVYPQLLMEAGYHSGYTGKGWGPGNWKVSGRTTNPAGKEYNAIKFSGQPDGISEIDYAGNFRQFYAEKSKDQPFCFWFGAHEPHRKFGKGIGLKNGKKLEDVVVPDFLPDTREVRSDILDYCFEIEWFDRQLGKIWQQLEEKGELENTLVIVTSDNGMAFPRAKANAYEYGTHVPLAVCWPGKIKRGWTDTSIFSMVNMAPTILEAAQIKGPAISYPMAGTSMLGRWLQTAKAVNMIAYASRERHSSARYNNLGYPQRSLREGDYLYIRNFRPDLWPAGDPYSLVKDPQSGNMVLSGYGSFFDIDAGPSLAFMVEKRNEKNIGYFLGLATDKRPAEELYNVKADPACLKNLATEPVYEKIRVRLQNSLENYLKTTADPRETGNGEIFETYPRLDGETRTFPPPGK